MERVRAAVDYRVNTVDMNACRLIFSEADFFPGMVVDKYNDLLVVESLALGIDRLKPMILRLLLVELKERGFVIRGIYERSDASVRKKDERQEVEKEFLDGKSPASVREMMKQKAACATKMDARGKLEKEKNRLEKTIAQLTQRLEYVEESLANM